LRDSETRYRQNVIIFILCDASKIGMETKPSKVWSAPRINKKFVGFRFACN